MSRYGFGRRPAYGERRRHWPRSRAAGCLLWVVLLIVLLIVLSVLFGGFQKGTKENGLGPVRAPAAAAASGYGGARPLALLWIATTRGREVMIHGHWQGQLGVLGGVRVWDSPGHERV